MIVALIASAIVIFLYFTALYVIALTKKDTSIVDIGWGIGFVLIAWFTLIAFSDFSVRQVVTTALITAWGVRLATHIYLRNRGKDEDWRYQEMRNKHGKWWAVRSYFTVFMLQGLLMWMVVLPVIHINAVSSVGATWLILLGVVMWIGGFFMESVADYHLTQHINEKRDGLLTSGLWAWSRHPNYFGEAAQWWGIGLIALASATWTLNPLQACPCEWWVLIGPLTITLLVRYISGVPPLEKKMSGRPEFETYKKRTSIFFPLPPKSEDKS